MVSVSVSLWHFCNHYIQGAAYNSNNPNGNGLRDMSQLDFQNADRLSAALAVTALPAAMMGADDAAFAEPDYSLPTTPESLRDIPFEPIKEFAGSKSEAEFEVLLQEFCQFARLGFTILKQSKSQLIEVADLLRSLGDGNAAEDLLKLVVSGRDKAELLVELTNAAKVRCEFAFLTAAGGAAA
jgi:hypothetical protein